MPVTDMDRTRSYRSPRAPGAATPSSPQMTPSDRALASLARDAAMNRIGRTRRWGVVGAADPAGLSSAQAAVERVVAEFDRACSRFRQDSELSRLAGAAGRWVQVGPVLLEAIREALRAAQLTDGDVDPTIGQALIA